MSRIRMAVKIRNDSDQPLILGSSQADWTDPWYPPPQIGPGETKEFRSEGDAVTGIPVTGTVGWVRYNIGGNSNQEIYIQWNSPLIESQYDNTFHVFGPSDWEISHWGGQGHEATLEVRLRRSAKHRVPNFLPSISGLHFSNSWSRDLPVISVGNIWNRLLDTFPDGLNDILQIARADENWLPITRADQGLCGGMVFIVMDYYHHHLLPPLNSTSPANAADELFRYIRDRLWDSFDVTGRGNRWLAYSSPHYPNGDEGVIQFSGLARGRSWVTYRDEWPKIRDDIDHGQLSPMGLVQTDSLDIGKNHQVLAYAYRQSGQHVTVWIYNPNHPNDEGDDSRLDFDITDTAGEVHIDQSLDPNKRIWCFFHMDGYVSKVPPLGRGLEALTLNQAVRRALGEKRPVPPQSVRVPTDVPGFSGNRPLSVRNWIRSL